MGINAQCYLILLGMNALVLGISWRSAAMQTSDIFRGGISMLLPALAVFLYLALVWAVSRDLHRRVYLRRRRWRSLIRYGLIISWIPYLFLVVMPGFYLGKNPGAPLRSAARKAGLTLLWLPLFLLPLALLLLGGKRDVPIDSRAEYSHLVGSHFRTNTAADIYLRIRGFPETGNNYQKPRDYVAIFDDPAMPGKYPDEYTLEQTVPAGLVVRVEKITACVGCWFDDAVYYTVVAEGLGLEHEDLELRICCGTQPGKSFNNQWFIEIHEGGMIEFNPKYLTPLDEDTHTGL